MAKRSKPTAAATNSDDNDDTSTRPIRLQRALAAAGFGSRRQCEEMILEGRVEVDGDIVDKLGTTVVLGKSKIYVDGSQLKTRRLVYFLVNKPTGVVTTNSDPEGRPRVIDLVPPGERVFPVGRLDRASEGLILLTNDGELAQRLAHPRFEVPKVYRVTVAGNVTAEALRDMRKGIYIAEGVVRVEGAKVLKVRSKSTELEIILKEGKNREIRRILARLGHKVLTLKRIAMGPLRLADLPTGAYRRLTHEELKRLQSGEPAASPEANSNPESAESSETPTRTKGRVTRKAPASKRSPRPSAPRDQATPSASRGTKPRPRTSSAESEFPFPFRQNRVGAVIGSDSPPAARDKPLNLRSADDEEENRIIRPRPKGADKPRRPSSEGRTNPEGRTTPDGRPTPQASPDGAKGKRKPPVRGQARTGNARTENARTGNVRTGSVRSKQARIEADAETDFDSIDQPSADQPPRKRPRPPVQSRSSVQARSSVQGRSSVGKKSAAGKSGVGKRGAGKRDGSKRITARSIAGKTPSRKSAPGKRPGGRANRRGSARGS